MSVDVQERPFRVPGYAGYVPGLKYSFGHTYGYSESRLFKSQHPELQARVPEKLRPYISSVKKVDDSCLSSNGVHQKISQLEDRRVQWNDGPDMEVVNPHQHASIQCSLEGREGVQSAATQWSDQEAHHNKTYNAATQWSPFDFSPFKSIPGYTGHLPGRNYVSPGKTFCQEMDALLTTFNPNSKAILPLSRHNFTSALQQMPERKPEGLDDPYFDNRPPSTYANNYPIPGYQGFVPRVRTSTSSLGIRYIKAVEKSLQSLHDRKSFLNIRDQLNEDIASSPKKLLDKRPLHTPRHKPHPKHQLSEEDDWRSIYNRPPSTYLDDSRTFIPGYKGFVPHLRGSPNVVGIRYSKAAQKCLEKTFPKAKHQEVVEDIPYQEVVPQNTNEEEDKENKEIGTSFQVNGEDSERLNCDLETDEGQLISKDKNRLQRNTSVERPNRQEYSDYFRDRKPSTYKSDDRYPIPGYQGFVPRLRDSPTTLGLRYTKAAVKTLEDVHRSQAKKVNG